MGQFSHENTALSFPREGAHIWYFAPFMGGWIRIECVLYELLTGMNGIYGSQDTVGDYKDASRDMDAWMHKSWRIPRRTRNACIDF